jgi:hypothetical protein
VIAGIYYAPADPDGPRSLRADDFEFVEIYNRSSERLDLSQWQISGAITWNFEPGQYINPGESQLLVRIDPLVVRERTLFQFTFNVAADVVLHGPYDEALDNESAEISVLFTGLSGTPIVADRVRYENRAPWPRIIPDEGRSLTRTDPAEAGSSPSFWRAAAISPGTSDFLMRQLGDANGDGQFDIADITHVLGGRKYMSGESASFDEGDWNGDGVFTTLDIVVALQAGRFLASDNLG